MSNTHTTHDRRTVLMLAALANCDPRTARRALDEGVDAIRTEREREALRAGMAQLAVAGTR